MNQRPTDPIKFEEGPAGAEREIFIPAGSTMSISGKFFKMRVSAAGTKGWADEVDAVKAIRACVPIARSIMKAGAAEKAMPRPKQI
jgi:hypothetical protein